MTDWMWASFVDGAEWVMLPNVIGSTADIDLNMDSAVYEGMSIGLEWTGTTGTVTGLLP